MSTLDRYVLTRVSRLFLPALLGLGLLFFTGGAFRLLRDEDLSLRQIALALPCLVPYLLPYLLPVAYAASGALALARLTEQRELLALSALGVPRRRVLGPALLLGLPLAGLSLLITAEVAPAAYRVRREVAKAILLQLGGGGEHVSRSLRAPGLRVYARRVEGKTLHGLVVDQQSLGRDESVQVVARSGELSDAGRERELVLALSDVSVTYRPAPSRPLSRQPSGPVRLHLPSWHQALLVGAGVGPEGRRIESRTSAELRQLAAAGPTPGGDRRDLWFKARLELAYRLALGLAPLAVAVTGFPLALLAAGRPLLAFVLGAAGGCGAAFVPLLVARTLAETLRQPAWLTLGVVVPLAFSLALLPRLEAQS